jgi:predicted RNase H-like HicB family nuclease
MRPALPGCVSQEENEKAVLENINGTITAWLWAEDQKTAFGFSDRRQGG